MYNTIRALKMRPIYDTYTVDYGDKKKRDPIAMKKKILIIRFVPKGGKRIRTLIILFYVFNLKSI